MVKEIVKDTAFLSIRSTAAARKDMQIIRDLADTLEANKEHCAGMAANMIGESKTILAAYISGEILVMINPVIVDHSVQSYETEEYCLSLSGSRKAKCYMLITVEYLDKKFKKKRAVFRGFEAQVIQHEIDHFQGVLI